MNRYDQGYLNIPFKMKRPWSNEKKNIKIILLYFYRLCPSLAHFHISVSDFSTKCSLIISLLLRASGEKLGRKRKLHYRTEIKMGNNKNASSFSKTLKVNIIIMLAAFLYLLERKL